MSNNTDIHLTARVPVNCVSLHEEYNDTAPSDNVTELLKNEKSEGEITKESEITVRRYATVRKIPLISDPQKCISYKMEVLKDGNTSNKPLFQVTSEKGEQLDDEDRLRLNSGKEDEHSQSIRLLSYCKRHRPSDQCIVVQDSIGACQQSDFIPSPNPSGCARTEPYNYLGKRGRKQPQSRETVSLKRLYLENMPYLVGGYSQHESLSKVVSQCNTSSNFSFMAEKYSHMKKTFRKRLAFGKSGIHGYGIFAKQPHMAGDMVIEYTGEVVRSIIADKREHLTYDSLVGAGTCMFQIDDDHFIDATKAGNIAQLINHSCEPNCFSRIITVNGDGHVIIFAKRDIEQWEELTYNYRHDFAEK